MTADAETIHREGTRIEREYRRRENEIASDLYAPWQPAESFALAERKFAAARLLHKAGKFPAAGDKCLEIGYGKIGWLADLISWGLRETDLHGIELDAKRSRIAQTALPKADLRTGDATKLPWQDGTFKIVIASTVFSSILDAGVRQTIAEEIQRVLPTGGVLLWYDLAIDNPRNPNVKSLTSRELENLFPNLSGEIKSITLAPPIARAVAPVSLTLAAFLNAFPFLRTHLIAALVKN